MFEEHLLGGLFAHFTDFFQNLSCRHITILPEQRKQKFLTEHIKILPGSLEVRKISQIFLQNTSLSAKQTKVNYMKNSSCRIPPNLPGAKYREKTRLVCATRWLLSIWCGQIFHSFVYGNLFQGICPYSYLIYYITVIPAKNQSRALNSKTFGSNQCASYITKKLD